MEQISQWRTGTKISCTTSEEWLNETNYSIDQHFSFCVDYRVRGRVKYIYVKKGNALKNTHRYSKKKEEKPAAITVSKAESRRRM